jgi:Flp pilus assembly protein CpaB
MELEYKDPSKKGRWIVLLGVVLAIVAGASAFYLLNNATQQATTSGVQTISGYVAARPILARKAMVAEDIVLRSDIPLDGTNAQVITDPNALVGRLLAVDVAPGQLLTPNLLASGTVGLGFAILRPDETVAPDSEAWRAVSITVADDRAVGGVLNSGMSVDVFMTATISVPEEPPFVSTDPAATPAPRVSALDGFVSGRTTKVSYQGMKILSRAGTSYILKVPLVVAEEISHLQAEGSVQFSMALRPDQDERILDVSLLGTTNNRIIQRYGLPVPQPWPTLNGPMPSVPPIPALTPPPSPLTDPAVVPSASPAG